MKVVILNTSGCNGGAAVVSLRLMRALRENGIDARMLVVDRGSGDEFVDIAGTPEQRKWAFYRERFKIWTCNGFSRSELFKVSIANMGVDVLSHDWIKSADIVCLNWINQGMMSLRDIGRLCRMGKKVVWTMHDMWCCTGICHHSYGCMEYEEECGNCKFLHSHRSGDLSHRVWLKKKRLFDKGGIHFVAVSNWLAGCCRNSSLLAGKPLSVIPNALPIEKFDYHRLPSDGTTVVAMGAARLDDPVKGFDLMIEAANYIADNHKEDAKRIKLLLFGNLRDESLLGRIRIAYEWIGPVKPDEIPGIYKRSDVVLSSSHFETLPTTLVEGQAAGCLAVAFDHGGQSDIVEHCKTGYLAAYPDTEDLAAGIVWASRHAADRQALHAIAASRFSTQAIASAYCHLFENLK